MIMCEIINNEMLKKVNARVIAMYLPQYHPIPENDKVWGKGFTEWTNVVQARPMFKGHYQPRIPADLGFYDLRIPEVREEQANLARNAGIEGFMYWHYWFGNDRMLLERPFNEVLSSGSPDFPFCLGWANHSWSTKTWTKGNALAKSQMIMEQLYPGEDDWNNHFNYCLKAFKDKRYIKVDGKPIFTIFAPLDVPNVSKFIEHWRNLAIKNGLKGIHFVGLKYGNVSVEELLSLGFDAVNNRNMANAMRILDGNRYFTALKFKLRKFGLIHRYDFSAFEKVLLTKEDSFENVYPTIISGFDRTARSGKDATVLYNCTPETFKKHVDKTIKCVQNKDNEHKIIYLMSWNEWGEGNYMEPDLKYGHGFLKALKDCLFK